MAYLRNLLQKTTESFWINFAFLVVFSGAMIVNSLWISSMFVGIASSLAFLYMSSTATGRLLFHTETRATRTVLGLTTFTSLMVFTGIALTFVGRFTQIISLIATIVLSLVLFVASARRRLRHIDNLGEPVNPEPTESKNANHWLTVIPFLLLISINFILLLAGRTGEGGASVWLTIPSMFIPTFLATSLLLAVILLFTNLGDGSKLALITVFSFLALSLFLLVWYPGRYGDPWSHLGEARYLAKAGMPYAYDRLISRGLFVDIIRYRGQQVLVVLFQRMFCVDIYWVYVIHTPLLWAISVPFFSYKIAQFISTRKGGVFPFLAAISMGIFPSLIGWGAVSVPNSLGFIFFFLAIVLLFFWAKERRREIWILGLLVCAVSFFAHPQTGLFSSMLFFLGSAIMKFRHRILKILGFPLIFASYPLSMYYFGASFSLTGLIALDNFNSFQSETSTILVAVGLVGLVLGIQSKYLKVKESLMLFVFYLTILFEYYFTRYGMTGWPYGPGRILVMGDLMFAPYVALGLLIVVEMLTKKVSSFSARLLSGKFNVNISLRILGLLLICLLFSVQVTSSLYRAYPRDEIVKVQPTAYEIEAIYYINHNATGLYAVVCSTIFAGLASGFLGADYAYAGGVLGWFGTVEYGYPLQRLYLQMVQRPSISIMKEAMGYISAETSYFVVSERDPDFQKAVMRTSNVLPVDKVFGNGKLYVYRYPLKLVEEPGPEIKVIVDDGASVEYVPTQISYMFRAEANATLSLSGHSGYNVTDYPLSWTFLELTVNNISALYDPSSKVGTFIYKSGISPNDVLTVKWLLNLNYPDVGLKEESFDLSQWRRYAGSITPTIITDGNILSISWNYVPPQYQPYYLIRECNISTSEYQYIMIRWKSAGPIAVAGVYFEVGGQLVVPYGSSSKDWTVTIAELEPNHIIRFLVVGITNLADPKSISDLQVLYVDFILIANQASS